MPVCRMEKEIPIRPASLTIFFLASFHEGAKANAFRPYFFHSTSKPMKPGQAGCQGTSSGGSQILFAEEKYHLPILPPQTTESGRPSNEALNSGIAHHHYITCHSKTGLRRPRDLPFSRRS